MTTIDHFTSEQLRKMASIKEQIEALEAELAAIGGGGAPTPVEAPKGRRKMSAAAKARIAAGQKARWAKVHATDGEATADEAAPKKRRKMNAAWKAKLAAAAKARWAKAKAAGKSSL